VPLQRQGDLVRAHPAAIVGHFDEVETARRESYRDAARARIERVLDQFLDCRRRALDHLAGSDAVDERIGQASDFRHLTRG
jgi:hypothetical protein